MNKKGFTLIELLAVIVILALIALIATPMVLNTIDDARKGTAKSSATTYVKELETEVIKSMLTTAPIAAGKYKVGDITVEVKGDTPTEGYVCVASDGTVEKASILLNDYVISYDGKEAITTDKEKVEDITCTVASTSYQEYYTGTKDVVSAIYYNPVDNIKCTETDYNNNADKLGKTGCLKWYAIENSGSTKSTVDVILDHNTTALVVWNSSGYNADGMNEVQTEFDNLVSTSEWKVTPRLITADEVAQITGNSTFSGETSTTNFYFGSNNQNDTSLRGNYSWLYDYTKECTNNGCSIADSSTYGYWTSTPVAGYTNCAWNVYSFGHLNIRHVANTDGGGVRPVITISKDILK